VFGLVHVELGASFWVVCESAEQNMMARKTPVQVTLKEIEPLKRRPISLKSSPSTSKNLLASKQGWAQEQRQGFRVTFEAKVMDCGL